MSLKKRVQKAVKKVTQPILHKPFDPKSYKGAGEAFVKGTIAMVSGPTYGAGTYLAGKQRAKRRDLASQEGTAQAEADKAAATIEELKEDALQKYHAGTVDPTTQEAINRNIEIKKAQLREQAGKAGIGDSDLVARESSALEQGRITEMNKARNEEFKRAMTLLGIDAEAQDIIQKMAHEDQMQWAQSYASVMEALGKIGSMAAS